MVGGACLIKLLGPLLVFRIAASHVEQEFAGTLNGDALQSAPARAEGVEGSRARLEHGGHDQKSRASVLEADSGKATASLIEDKAEHHANGGFSNLAAGASRIVNEKGGRAVLFVFVIFICICGVCVEDACITSWKPEEVTPTFHSFSDEEELVMSSSRDDCPEMKAAATRVWAPPASSPSSAPQPPQHSMQQQQRRVLRPSLAPWGGRAYRLTDA